MKVPIISRCERNFLDSAFKEGLRLDGRDLNEFRHLELNFGADFGCCYVTLGETKVLAQATCEIDEPLVTRPNEGMLYINVEYGPMATGEFNRSNPLAIQINRFLEKCLKESRCLDLESLCIISEEQVWVIRIFINILNNDGNLMSCCSIAAIAALAHFRIPLVTFEETKVTVHSPKEKPPLPLSIHHYPVAIKYVFLDEGKIVVADPTELEEKVSEAELIFGMNGYRELCALHFGGKGIMSKALVLSRSREAAQFAADVVKLIRSELEKDGQRRKETMDEGDGLVDCINTSRLLAASQDRNTLRVATGEIIEKVEKMIVDKEPTEESDNDSETENNEDGTKLKSSDGESTVRALVSSVGKEWTPSGGDSSWKTEDVTTIDSSSPEETSEEEETSDEETSDDDVEVVGTITDADRIVDNIELSGDSEEEETTMLTGTDVEKN